MLSVICSLFFLILSDRVPLALSLNAVDGLEDVRLNCVWENLSFAVGVLLLNGVDDRALA